MQGVTIASENPTSLSGCSVFIVGNARSGTSAFCSCLNLSPEIHLLYEASFFVNFERPDFVAAFNRQHEAYGNTRGKGTYLAAELPGETGEAVLRRLALCHRYVGEKVAFGPLSRLNGRPYQDVFFEFQARRFPDSHYFAIVRRPSESVWSMSKMWPAYGVDSLIACWLRTLILTVELYGYFRHTRVLFWDRFSPAAAERLARVLGVDLEVTPGTLSAAKIQSALTVSELPPRLKPFRGVLRGCEDLFACLRSVFSSEEFRLAGPNGHLSYLEDLVGRATDCLRRAEHRITARVAGTGAAFESGERLVPDKADTVVAGEHQSRYAFASRFVKGKRVLDVGCGAGYGSDLLASAGAARVLGVDVSAEAVNYANLHYARPGLEFKLSGSAGELALGESFDVVVMLEVIEHIDDAESFLDSYCRLLVPEGVLVLSTPNQAEHPGELFNPFHVREYRREQLTALLKERFEVVRLFGFGFLAASAVLSDPSKVSGLTLDDSCHSISGTEEPPFFVAVCGKDDQAVGEVSGVLYPILFDRHIVHEWRRLNRRAAATELAEHLMARAFTEPETFRIRFARVDAEVHEAMRGLIERCLQMKEFEVAGRLLEILLELQPDRPDWHYLYACFLHWNAVPPRRPDLSGALEHFGQALAGGFDEYWIRLNRGALLATMGKFEQSELELTRAGELQPASAEAREAWKRTRLVRVRADIEAGAYFNALDLLNEDRLGESAERDYLLGFCFHQLGGRSESALACYAKALSNGFDEFWVRVNRGQLLRQLGRLDEAEQDLAKAVELSPHLEWVQRLHQSLIRFRDH